MRGASAPIARARCSLWYTRARAHAHTYIYIYIYIQRRVGGLSIGIYIERARACRSRTGCSIRAGRRVAATAGTAVRAERKRESERGPRRRWRGSSPSSPRIDSFPISSAGNLRLIGENLGAENGVRMLSLVLGIDVGTTSVKVVVVQKETQQILANQSKETQANVPSDLGIEGNKQDVPKILSAIHNCISRLPKDLLRQVEGIGICGQMHGVTLWKSPNECAYKENGHFKLDIDKDKVSNLYTWQDGRCDKQFLQSLPRSTSHLPVHTGYGCATLFWFAKNKPEKLAKYDRSGTVQDLVVSLLCANDEVKMSTQNAASWGYFLTESGRWDEDALTAGGFPLQLLPTEILAPGRAAGQLAHEWFGIPARVAIGVALGDLQCSVYALLKEPTNAVLNISTSAQLAYVHPTFKPDAVHESQKIEYFPYFDDKYLAVAASLNGGNTLATFVRSVQQWTLELGFSVPQSKVWDKLIALANDDSSITNMAIIPTLLGERYAPDQTASATGITLDTLQLGSIFRALCSGLIKNLHGMMPRKELDTVGIDRIVGNGSGLVRNPVLQKEVSSCYGLPLELGHTGDAPLGAALAIIRNSF